MVSEYWHVGLIGLFLVGFSIHFLLRFVVPSFSLSKELETSIAALKRLRAGGSGDLTDLEKIADDAMSGATLAHLWREYTKTLHPQRRDDGLGQSRVVRWRSTALSETFFTDQAIVDSRLKTEFFKHLPGVLTGLGIIGTFSGLILGLLGFKVSSDIEATSNMLGRLVDSVGHAFYVSAAAITLAMLFTWVEKAVVSARYRQAERLREQIDSLFQGGAGEEYLERLVLSSESSATQSAQIKDALVADLKEILTSLTVQQIEAQSRTVAQMSTDIGDVIARSLEGPMTEIKDAVKVLGTDQGAAVNDLIAGLLKEFTAEIRDIFGKEISGLTERMSDASASMQATATEFAKLAANMDSAGTHAVDAMGRKLTEVLETMERRQTAMNEQMASFVNQIKVLVSDSQTESSQALQTALTDVSKHMTSVVTALESQAREAATAHGERQQGLEKSARDVGDSLSRQVDKLLAQSIEVNTSLQGTVDQLVLVTTKAVTGLSTGAQTLQTAATDFARAGDGVSETMRASAQATEQIRTSSTQLASATEGARAVFADYARTRDSFASMLQALEGTIENASRDAAMTSNLVSGIKAAADQLSAAQNESEKYLQGVTEVLVKAHESFRDNLERTLQHGNAEFHSELSTAVQLLSGAIKNLGDVAEDLTARV